MPSSPSKCRKTRVVSERCGDAPERNERSASRSKSPAPERARAEPQKVPWMDDWSQKEEEEKELIKKQSGAINRGE